MTPPINVKLPRPTSPDAAWLAAEPVWIKLNEECGGNPDFYPLTIKFGYVFGVIHGISQSVGCLLRSLPSDISLFPAYGVFASGVELLGRCLNGSDGIGSAARDLRTGFNWLVEPIIDDTSTHQIVSQTSAQAYTVGTLVQLRHFASHGQKTVVGAPPTFDDELLKPMSGRMGTGLENYWWRLNNDDDSCESLARAEILQIRSWPILQSWYLFQGDGRGDSITGIFSRFDWQAHPAR